MYPEIPSSRIKRGLIIGFKCPITGAEFAGFDPSHTTVEQLFQLQKSHTLSVMEQLDGGRPNLDRKLEEYVNQYRSQQ